MKDETRNKISNHLGDANHFIQCARESLTEAIVLRRGARRELLEEIQSDLSELMTDVGLELDELEPDGCPF